MKRTAQLAILIALLALLGLTVTGVYLTRAPANATSSSSAHKPAQTGPAALVDERVLETAQSLATLAVTPEEQDFAADALLISDHELELSIAYALRQAAAHPAPLTPETRELAARIKAIEPQVKAQKAEVERLKQALAAAPPDKKPAAQEQLELAQTQLELSQDELEDARQDLIRAGGDPQAELQRKLDEHEASRQRKTAPAAARPGREASESASAISNFLAWRDLNHKRKLLVAAQAESRSRAEELAARHERLEAELRAEQAAKPASGHQASAGAPSPMGAHPSTALGAGAGAPLQQPMQGAQPGETQASAATSSASTATAASILSLLERRKNMQQAMAAIDKRVQDFRELEEIYGNWSAFVRDRQRAFLNRLLWSAGWILLIALLTMLAEPLLQRLFARLAPDYKRLHTLRTLAHFVARAAGVILILLVLFGPPNQLATIIAFAGAGLTVALKNFIVSFFGWFVLMGRNGIRPGDWVEINGVGGEVLEVGLLHTVLLETGNWSDAGHPTGRKVTFVNSFAIEGHYFNFSTSGQWLWDELQVLVPAGADPYATADAIQKIAAAETRANGRLAEQEWQRAVQGRLPGEAQRSFSAEPVMNIRPSGGGVTVFVRYITRVQERQDVRARLYREVIELLHRKHVPQQV
jgi:small-conductance mechanosensitive channel